MNVWMYVYAATPEEIRGIIGEEAASKIEAEFGAQFLGYCKLLNKGDDE